MHNVVIIGTGPAGLSAALSAAAAGALAQRRNRLAQLRADAGKRNLQLHQR